MNTYTTWPFLGIKDKSILMESGRDGGSRLHAFNLSGVIQETTTRATFGMLHFGFSRNRLSIDVYARKRLGASR